MPQILTLSKHPNSPELGVERAEVVVQREDHQLCLSYRLQGNFHELQLPELDTVHRSKFVWKSTSFELFMLRSNSNGYRQFTFAANGAWTCIDYAGYRREDDWPSLDNGPQMQQLRRQNRFELKVRLPFEILQHPARRLGLAVLLEDQESHKSYWALTHTRAQPDFHDIDSFQLEWP